MARVVISQSRDLVVSVQLADGTVVRRVGADGR
jgi:hypothetical protein